MAQHTLTARRVSAVRKRGYYGDGGGLYLRVSEWGTKGWIFRYSLNGRTHDMGLGSIELVSLAEARDKALACRKLLLERRDPIKVRDAERTQAKLAAAQTTTFAECAAKYVAAHEARWKNDKHRKQWRQTLEVACDTLGELPVAAIDTGLVLKVLEPIWTSKPETASRLRGRIERVLSWATVRGYRQGSNPATWRGHLQHMLQTPAKRDKTHFAALPYAEIGTFMRELRARREMTARALEFLILTASRSNEVIGARWDEIDMAAKTWTIPSTRMKMGKLHRVPLSTRALEIVRALPRDSDLVFAGLRDRTMLALLKTLRPVTTHGFRSSFTDWAHECTNHPKVVIDAALAHTIGDKVEAAYRRGELFVKRGRLMADWARYCEQTPVTSASGDVIAMRRS
jgi:integrase